MQKTAKKAVILVGGSRIWKVQQTKWKVGGYFFVEVTTEDKSKKSLFSTRSHNAWEWGVKL